MGIGCFCEGRSEIEMDGAAADGAADLRISGTQIAQIVMWQRLVLRPVRQRVCDAVRQSAQLGEQQREYEQETDRQGVQHAAHANG